MQLNRTRRLDQVDYKPCFKNIDNTWKAFMGLCLMLPKIATNESIYVKLKNV